MRSLILPLVFLITAPGLAQAEETDLVLPAGTPVFLVLQDSVISTFADASWAPSREGDDLDAVVWRDVVVDRFILIRAGAGARVRVTEITKESPLGRKGEITLTPLSAVGSDGQFIELAGDFSHSGQDAYAREFLAGMFSYGLGGSNKDRAWFKVGSVISSRVKADATVTVIRSGEQTSEVSASALLARIMLESLERGKKIRLLPIELSCCEERVVDPEIVTFNGEEIRPLPLKIREGVIRNDCSLIITELEFLSIKDRFAAGVNWFEIQSGNQRAEIIVLPSEIMHGRRP